MCLDMHKTSPVSAIPALWPERAAQMKAKDTVNMPDIAPTILCNIPKTVSTVTARRLMTAVPPYD
jgi:hypothetical protein